MIQQFSKIQEEHQLLIEKSRDESGTNIQLVEDFLDRIARSGEEVGDADDRAQLRAFIRYWSSVIYDNTGKFPRIELYPYLQPSVNVFSSEQVVQQGISIPPALHQLRAPVGDFVGRKQEIEQLVQALTKTSGAAASVISVRGMGGIGKTELAYTAAQQLKQAFPDAQLLVELHGDSDTPLPPAQALQRVIRSFERAAMLPDDISQLQGIYRSVLNNKRVLILADDARDVGQVRPLMPPPGCALLVTSRNRFSLPGMAAFDLGVLPPTEAERLLLEICPRIAEYAKELAELCGYLPLALRVGATLLIENDSRDVATYLKQLRAERLRYLRDPDDPSTSVEASLQLSYNAVERVAQSALCQASVFPASFDVEAAKAVVVVEEDVIEVLGLLRRRSLLEWDDTAKRYSLRDLVRYFAAARLEDADAVQLRYARHYAAVAEQAHRLYLTGGTFLLTGLALFDQERVHIDVGWDWARERAGDQDADALLLDYANATTYIGDLRYDTRRERIPQLEVHLATARRIGRRKDEGYALGNLGIAYADLGEAHKAIDFFEQYLAVAREIGDRRGEGQALGNLGIAYKDLGDARQAISFYEQGLIIARELDDRYREGQTLGNLGLAYADLGDAHRAITFHDQQLVIAREIGDRRGEGQALGNLGIALANLGDAHRAITFHEQGLVIAREIGDRRGEGQALGNLGIALANLGDAHRAITFHEQGLVIARELDDRRGEGIALNNLGIAYANLGDAHRAITFYEQALVVARELGDRHSEALVGRNLGLALEKQGDLARAVELIQVFMDYLREIGHPDAEKRTVYLEQLRQRLADGDGGR